MKKNKTNTSNYYIYDESFFTFNRWKGNAKKNDA